MPKANVFQIEQNQRLETKLTRELGDIILDLFDGDLVEDIVLNPDSGLWAKEEGSGFRCVGTDVKWSSNIRHEHHFFDASHSS